MTLARQAGRLAGTAAAIALTLTLTATTAHAGAPRAVPAAAGGAVPAAAHAMAAAVPAAATTTVISTVAPRGAVGARHLDDPGKKELAMRLVSSAENSSLNWRAQYAYIEDIGDGRGYTAGIIGFCSGTGDMLQVVQRYTRAVPRNVLARYLPALRKVDGTASHAGLGARFVAAWRTAARDARFQRAQDAERDAAYFIPAVRQAKRDGLRALGQFAYYDAIVMHGPGVDPASFGGIRRAATAAAKIPAQGGSEVAYLNAFLSIRAAAMRREAAHSDTTRVDTAQRVFLRAGNLHLNPTLTWKVYGDTFRITAAG